MTLPFPASPEILNHSRLRQRTLTSLIAGCTFAGAAAWPVASHAVGLGALSGEAVIGEALQLSVPLTGPIDQPIENECISVRRTSDPVDPEFFPRDLAARIDRVSGSARIVLTSRSAVRHPLVEFRISVSCGYNLSHDYLVMATPRDTATSATAAPAASAPAAPAYSVQPTTPVPTGTPNAVAAPTVAANNQLPDGLAGRNVTLDRELTLEQLARQNFPGPLRQQRFMRWVIEANPQLFAGAGKLRQHRLQRGTSLTIPDGVPPRRPGDHQGAVTPLGEQIDAAGVAPPAPRSTPTSSSGATRTAGDSRKDRLVVGGSARSLKEAVAIVDQLTGMMEKQLAAQTAYNEKIKELESSVEGLGKQVKGLETDAVKREAAWQAERQAEKSAREQEAEQEWWKLLAAVVGGGLVGAGTLFGLKSLFGRRRSMAEDLADLPIENAAPLTTNPEIPKPGPLTEFGWGDEVQHPHRAATPGPTAPPANAVARQASTIESALEKMAATPTHQTIDFELPASIATGMPRQDIGSSDPATAAIELANIMTSMGLAESAAQTLVEHIRENPRESLPQWLKLLEIHRLNGNRSEFERSASELRQHFNVQPDDWTTNATQGRMSLESYPHIRAQLVKLWRTADCLNLLRGLLLDNREGTRLGFPLAVAEEILVLIAILNSSK